MSKETIAAVTENQVVPTLAPEGAAPTPETPKAPEPVKVQVSIKALANGIVGAIPGLAIRPTKADGYAVLQPKENGDAEFKKGIFFQVDGGKTLNLKLRLNYTKSCDWLTKHTATIAALAKDDVKWNKDRDVGYLQVKLPNTLTLDEMIAKAVAFHDLVSPAVAEIRGLAPVVSKKETKAPEAPETTAPEAAAPEAPKTEPEVAEAPKAPEATETTPKAGKQKAAKKK